MALERVKRALTTAGNWLNEKVLEIDPEKSDIPDKILQEALEQVNYEGDFLKFRMELTGTHWIRIHYRYHLISFLTNRINHSVDLHQNLVHPQLLKNNGRVFKGILNTFCLQGYTSGSHITEAVDQLAFHSGTLKSTLMNKRFENLIGYGDEDEIAKIIDTMFTQNLIKEKRDKDWLQIYLTKQIDPILK